MSSFQPLCGRKEAQEMMKRNIETSYPALTLFVVVYLLAGTGIGYYAGTYGVELISSAHAAMTHEESAGEQLAPQVAELTPDESWVVVSDRQLLRQRLPVGTIAIVGVGGRPFEVLGHVSVPRNGVRQAAGYKKFRGRADYDATEECNEPDMSGGRYWGVMPDGRNRRQVNVCRWLRSVD